MDIEEIIQRIVDNGRIEDMKTLSDILEETMELIKRYDPDCYKQYEMELYKMAFGDTLNKEMAEDIVSHMRPFSEKWAYNEVKRIQEERGLNNISTPDFYSTMNMAYNDYYNMFGEDIESYIRFTLDFIEDEDAKEGKVFKYFTQIVEI